MAKSEPVGIALLFCDYFVEEKNSGKKTLAGVFSVMWGKKFPLQVKPFWLFASFTNLKDEHSFALNISSTTTKNVIFNAGGKLGSNDRNGVIELAIPVGGLMFPEPGNYSVCLFIDGGSALLNRTLYVKELKSG